VDSNFLSTFAPEYRKTMFKLIIISSIIITGVISHSGEE